MLFATVAVARTLGVDAETALRRTITRFAERYQRSRRSRRNEGIDVDSLSEAEARTLFREARRP